MKALPLQLQLALIDKTIQLMKSDFIPYSICAVLYDAYIEFKTEADSKDQKLINKFERDYKRSLIPWGTTAIERRALPLFTFGHAMQFLKDSNLSKYDGANEHLFWFKCDDLNIRIKFLNYLRSKIINQIKEENGNITIEDSINDN